MDITEPKQAEEALQQSVKLQAQLAHTAASVPGMIYSFLMCPDGSTRMPYASGALSEVFGLRPEDVIDDAAPVFSLIHPGDLGHVMATIAESARTLNPWRDEFRVRHARLGEIWVEGHSVPQREPDGSTLWHGFVQDITERKQAEAALHWKTALLEAQVNSSIDGILVVDQQGKKMIQNQRVADLFKIPRAIADGNDDADQVKWVTDAVKNPGQFADKVAHLYSHPDEISRDEIELKDGTILDRYSAPLVGEDGKCHGRIWTFHDITERKRAEEKLGLFRALIEQSNDGLFVMDPTTGRFLDTNESACRLLGYTRDELLALTVLEVTEGMDRAAFEAGNARLDKEGHATVTARHRCKDGTTYPIEVSLSLVVLDRKYVVAVVRDITERKQAQVALQQERNLLRTLIDHIPDYIYVRDLSNRFVLANASFARLMGVPGPTDLIGKRDADFYPAEKAASFDKIDQEVLAGRPIFNRERALRFPNGQELATLNTKVPFKNDRGEVIGLIGVGRDITVRKQAEAALQQERNLLRTLIDHIPDYIYVRDLSNRFVLANEAFARLMGVPGPSALIGKRDADFYPAEKAASFNQIDQEVFAGRPIHNRERALRFPNGQELATLNTKVPFKNDRGEVIGLIGVGRDITERKRAEAAMVEASGLIQTLLQNTTDAIYFKDLQSRFVHFSAEMLRIFHLTRPEELKGRTDFDFFSDEHARPAFETEQEIIRTGNPVKNLEEKETHRDGRITWVSSSKMPWRDAAGNVIGTMGISRSITRQKEAQVELENLHQKLVDASRQAGMAEVATSVLHNVGNVLNSVNISTSLVIESAKKSKASSLAQVVTLLQEHARDLGTFITQNSRGKHVPAYSAQLSQQLLAEQENNIRELELLRHNVEHIKEIVAMQQNYATFGGVNEIVNVITLVEDSLRMNAGAFSRHEVEVIRDFEAVPPLNLERHKVLQILVNLLRNAKYACDESERADKRLTVRVANGEDRIKISVIDNGVGIPPENLTRIFNHGFTTRKGGHGFGLHSGALAAKEMGGSLSVHSDGPGQGATFTLELPGPPQEHLP